MSQLRILLETILPLRTYTSAEALERVATIQVHNHRAFLSHRKRQTRVDGVP